MKEKELVKNRRAYHDYEILETFEAGISLLGTEIKSLRNHGGSLQEAYVTTKKGEAWLINASIAPYSFGTVYNHSERRERKLLLHKKEIARLRKTQQEKGMALIPLSFYLKNNRVKVRIGIGKGKKAFDKRSAIKEKEQKRMIQRSLKEG